jgi:hypothetical protein
VQPFTVEPHDDRDQRFDRAEILIELSAEAQRIGETVE